MKVLVTGAGGQVGREVVAVFGGAAVAFDHHGLDVTDAAAVRAAVQFAAPDAIIHCAGIPSPEDIEPADLVQTNTVSTFNALEESWNTGIRTAVLASSGAIYGTAWSTQPFDQPYLPVDEDSPLQYVDPYALTKDDGTARVLAKQAIDPARPHPMTQAGETAFNTLVWAYSALISA